MSEEEIIRNVKRIIEYKVISNYIDNYDCRVIQGLLDLYYKQQRKLKEVEDYVTSHDFFNLLCTPYTPGKRKPYFIAHDKLLAILEGDDKNE